MLSDLLRDIYYWGPKRCPACGRHARVLFNKVLWPELGAFWELNARQYVEFDHREGRRCARCQNSLRARQLAAVIIEQLNAKLGTNHNNLRALCNDSAAQHLKVAEINSLGALHPFLTALPGLRYSEYGSETVPSEDLSRLSYANDSFDIVLTSDTLEHVPDFTRALAEIGRVLKPDGLHIFTIPVVWDRDTRVRASEVGGHLVHHLPPSYHGAPCVEAGDFLVFHEFGRDVPAMIEAAGFELSVERDPINPALTVFIARVADPSGSAKPGTIEDEYA